MHQADQHIHRATPTSTFDDERQSPWLLALYAASGIGALLLSMAFPWGWAA